PVLFQPARPGFPLQPAMGTDRGQRGQPSRLGTGQIEGHTPTLRLADQVRALDALALPEPDDLGHGFLQARGTEVGPQPAVAGGEQAGQLLPTVALLAETVQAGD